MFVSHEFRVLHESLCRAQEARELFPNIEWIDFERLVMLAAVNKFRISRGFDLRSLEDVERVEQMASGHYDYTKKFALYCAELIHTPASEIRP